MNTQPDSKKEGTLGKILKTAWRVNRLVWKEKKGVILALLALLILLSAAPIVRSAVQGLFINELVKVAGSGVLNQLLLFFLVGIIAVDFLTSALNPIQTYLNEHFRSKVRQHFLLAVLKKKSELDMAVHEDPQNLTLMEKINQNGIWRMEAVPSSILRMLGYIITLLLSCAVIGLTEGWILLLIILGALPEVWMQAKIAKDSWQYENTFSEKRRQIWDMKYLFDEASSVMELKIFGNTGYFWQKIKTLWEQVLHGELRQEKRRALTQVFSMVLSTIPTALATVWFVWQVLQGHMQVGTMTFVIAAIVSFQSSLARISGETGYFYENILFASDVLQLLDLHPVIKSPPNAVVIAPQSTPEIIFENVTFTYPTAGSASLKNFSLTISPGEKIAFVGINGAGKTTFIKLLCRFYDPQQGRILVDGKDLRSIDLESWYRHLGIIFQDYSNYRLITKEAISLGNTRAPISTDAARQAAVSAEAHSFIDNWQQKYDQQLGKIFSSGVEPSGGQWQKLALSRVFYRGANVLVLDEPTAAIDAAAEAQIFEKMAALPKDKTVILISHRFSTVRQADRIAVVDAGRLIELGSHSQLLAADQTYARLFKLQAQGYQ